MTGTNEKPRRATAVSMLGAGVLLAAVLLALVNYFGWKYHQRMDWTASEIYSLSEKTENVLTALDQEIDAVVYMDPADELYQPVKELLARYEAASPSLSVREVDIARNLAEAEELIARYQIDAANVIVFASGEDRRLVEANDLAEYDYSGMQLGQAPRMTGFSGEQEFTSALLALTGNEQPRVAFTTGHGERPLTDFSPEGLSGAQELLERDNFAVESFATLGATDVPEGTQLVVIAGPTANFVPPEIELLESFLDAGGRLMVLLDPSLSPSGGLIETGLETLLSRYGIEVGDDIVVDPSNPMPFFGADTIFVNSYGSHGITRSLSQAQLPTILSLARSVTPAESIDGYTVTTLLRTSAEGWGETGLDDLGAVQLDDADLAGPVSLGVVLEASATEAPTDLGATDETADGDAMATTIAGPDRMVVFGDATFATNAQLQNIGNLTMFANALNWLAEREALVAIAPKTPESVRLNLSSSEMKRIFWFVVLGLPLLVIGVGIAVHRRRQR